MQQWCPFCWIGPSLLSNSHQHCPASFLALHLQAITPDSQAALSFNSKGIDITDDTMHDPVPGTYDLHARHNDGHFFWAFFQPNNWIYCIHYYIFQWFFGLSARMLVSCCKCAYFGSNPSGVYFFFPIQYVYRLKKSTILLIKLWHM